MDGRNLKAPRVIFDMHRDRVARAYRHRERITVPVDTLYITNFQGFVLGTKHLGNGVTIKGEDRVEKSRTWLSLAPLVDLHQGSVLKLTELRLLRLQSF